MTESAEPEIPIAWLSAEQTAADLLDYQDHRAFAGTFDFRAAQSVLALTLFLTRKAAGWPLTKNDLLIVTNLMALSSEQWLLWCRTCLASFSESTSVAEIDLAYGAYSWLSRSTWFVELPVAGSEIGIPRRPEPGVPCATGMVLAYRILCDRLHHAR